MRMTGLQAAVGLAQLEKIDEYVEARRENALCYCSLLCEKFVGDEYGEIMPVDDGAVYWMYGVRVPFTHKKQIRDYLAKKGIETRSYFIPIHKQKPYLGDARGNWRYSNSVKLHREGFYLPSGSGLTEKQIKYVCKHLIKAIEEVESK